MAVGEASGRAAEGEVGVAMEATVAVEAAETLTEAAGIALPDAGLVRVLQTAEVVEVRKRVTGHVGSVTTATSRAGLSAIGVKLLNLAVEVGTVEIDAAMTEAGMTGVTETGGTTDATIAGETGGTIGEVTIAGVVASEDAVVGAEVAMCATGTGPAASVVSTTLLVGQSASNVMHQSKESASTACK